MAHVALVAFGDGGEMRQCEISKSPYLLCVIFAFRAKEFSFIWPFWVDLSNENTERISSHASKCMSVVWAREKKRKYQHGGKIFEWTVTSKCHKEHFFHRRVLFYYYYDIFVLLFRLVRALLPFWLAGVCVCVTVVIVPLCLLAFRAKPLVFHLFFGCATFHLFLLCVFISFMLVLVFFSFALSLSLLLFASLSSSDSLSHSFYSHSNIYIFLFVICCGRVFVLVAFLLPVQLLT